MKQTFIALMLMLVFLAAMGSALAQDAAIQGVVTDPSGAYVPDVAITVTNIATGVVSAVKTNEQGFYSVPFLMPVRYKVEAIQAGFAPQTRELKVDVNQTARVDFTLRLGAVAESIEVTAAAALLESENTSVGQVIENKRIVEMPLNLRNYLELAQLSLGVQPARSQGYGARTGGEDGTEGGFIALGTACVPDQRSARRGRQQLTRLGRAARFPGSGCETGGGFRRRVQSRGQQQLGRIRIPDGGQGPGLHEVGHQ